MSECHSATCVAAHSSYQLAIHCNGKVSSIVMNGKVGWAEERRREDGKFEIFLKNVVSGKHY